VNAEISSVVRADYAQLFPDRTVTVMRSPGEKKSLLVKVLGLPNPAGKVPPGGGDNPGYQVDVAVEKRCSDVNKDMGWTADPDIKVEKIEEAGTLWSGKLTFNNPCGDKRILVQEYEVFAPHPHDSNKQSRKRVIYADVLEL